MDLSGLKDGLLLQGADDIAKADRDNLTLMIHHLREIEARRLYSALKYKSLFDYVVQRLKYSEDQAYRRISAMRLLKELPQLETKVESGELTLTNLTLAQTHFKREKKAKRECSKAQKIDLLEQLENKPTREAERVIAKISPEAPAERIRPVSENGIELKYTVTPEVLEQIEKLKGLLAHSHPNISLGELMGLLCRSELERREKTAAPRVTVRHKKVWERDKNCVNCGSNFALEIDHIVPRALGGDSSPQNLRVLCRSCNQRAAINVFGQRKMERYLR